MIAALRDVIHVASPRGNLTDYQRGRFDAFSDAAKRVRALRQVRWHELFRGMNGTGGEPDSDGWQDLPPAAIKAREAIAKLIGGME